MAKVHIFQDCLGYTYKVTETSEGCRWRKRLYKDLRGAKRAINKWAEGYLTKIR